MRSSQRAQRWSRGRPTAPPFWTGFHEQALSRGAKSLPATVYVTDSLRIRLSTGKDLRLDIPNDRVTVLEAKRLLSEQTEWPEGQQRWFVCGHMLPNRARLHDFRIPADFVVQVIVHPSFDREAARKIARPKCSSSSDADPPVVASTGSVLFGSTSIVHVVVPDAIDGDDCASGVDGELDDNGLHPEPPCRSSSLDGSNLTTCDVP